MAIKKDDVVRFFKYHEEYFGKDVLKSVMDEFEFDKSRLDDKNLDKLSSKELKELYADMVYFVVGGIGIDFETMYDLLDEVMNLDHETIEYLLDWWYRNTHDFSRAYFLFVVNKNSDYCYNNNFKYIRYNKN